MQIQNQEKISKLKDWQAEAFLYVVMCCCVDYGDKTRGAWDLSKICALYEAVGDIFKWDSVRNANAKVLRYRLLENYILDLKTNIRLLPKDSHFELINICSNLLNIGGTKEDANIRGIIEAEMD